MTVTPPLPALSTHLFAWNRLDAATIDLAAEVGFRRLEIFAAPQHFPIDDPRSAPGLHTRIEQAGMKLAAVHAPFYDSIEGLLDGQIYSLGDRSEELRDRAIAALKKLLPLAADLGSPNVVLHLGHRGADRTDDGLGIAGIAEVLASCPAYEGRLLVENTPGVAVDPAKFAAIRTRTDPERTGYCIDTGHLFLNSAGDPTCGLGGGGPAGEGPGGGGPGGESPAGDPFASILAATHHFHVHDNNGEKDEHLPPGEGKIDWETLLGRLPECPAGAAFALELRDPSRGAEPPRALLENTLYRVRGPVRDYLRLGGITL